MPEITALYSLTSDTATSLNKAKLIIYIPSVIMNHGQMIHVGSCNVMSKNSSLVPFYKNYHYEAILSVISNISHRR